MNAEQIEEMKRIVAVGEQPPSGVAVDFSKDPPFFFIDEAEAQDLAAGRALDFSGTDMEPLTPLSEDAKRIDKLFGKSAIDLTPAEAANLKAANEARQAETEAARAQAEADAKAAEKAAKTTSPGNP